MSIPLILPLLMVLLLLFFGVPIGVGMALSGMTGVLLLSGKMNAAISLPYVVGRDVLGNYGFVVIPMFVLLGELAAATGITTDLFNTAHRWIGHFRGGLASATILACAGMAAISGSSAATAAAMTPLALPQMRRFHYKDALSLGTICAGGTLSIMIPPSTVLVLYAIFADQSIGKCLMAGIFPGLLTAFLYIGQILVRLKIDPSLAQKGPLFSWRERLASTIGVIPFLIIILAILLGILFGVWTPVESAACGVVLVVIMGIARRRLKWRDIGGLVRRSLIISSSIMILVIGCIVFTKYLARSGMSTALMNFIIQQSLSPILLFSVLVMVYLILGMFFEAASMFALTVPILMPIINAIGWNPIWFAVVLTAMVEVACITPPVGLNLYAVKLSAPDVKLEEIWWSTAPYVLVEILIVYILFFAPDIALFLPNMMIKK